MHTIKLIMNSNMHQLNGKCALGGDAQAVFLKKDIV